MVARIPSPTDNDLELAKMLVSERAKGKNAKFFSGYLPDWKLRLDEYNNNGGNPEKIGASIVTEEDKDKYINLYLNAKPENCQYAPITNLRSPTPKLQFCPACGEDGTPSTLDHYLPKQKFPEFSVHLKNLVPMCDICQRIKGDIYLNEKNQKIFFHAYFDAIPIPIAYIEISPPYNAPASFILKVDDKLDALTLAYAQRHINGLNLGERIEGYCGEKYMHLLKLVSFQRSTHDNEVEKSIYQFLFMEEQKVANGWAALFYRSVLRNKDLIEYLAKGTLPDFLAVSNVS